MSGAQYDRWYLVPAVAETQAGDTGVTAKYHDLAGIDGFVGNTISPADVSPSYAGLTQQFPDVDRWYIARFYGTWAALNEMSIQADTRNLATNPGDVAAVLNQRFDLERDADSWARSFRIHRSDQAPDP